MSSPTVHRKHLTAALLALLLCSSAVLATSDLLLVVGVVTETSARVLVEWVGESEPQQLDFFVAEGLHQTAPRGADSLPAVQEFAPKRYPRAVILTGLQAGRDFSVSVAYGGRVDMVTFSTAPDASTPASSPSPSPSAAAAAAAGRDSSSSFSSTSTRPWRTVVLSCDRFLEDGDDDFVLDMGRELQRNYSFMLHLGDQIYADKLQKRYGDADFATALAAFRDLYRRAWTRPAMARLLRHGAHVMVPDDHDIQNALSPSSVPSPSSPFARAGLRAVYEYQLQLAVDIPEDSEAAAGESLSSFYQPLYGFYRFGSMAVAVLDLRFHRTFFPESDHAFLGSAQYAAFAGQLQAWEKDQEVKSIVVASSIPVLFPHPFLARVADWFEKERYSTHSNHTADTRQLLQLLEHAAATKSQVVTVAGDLHVMANQSCCSSSGVCFPMIVTSGITRASSILRGAHLFLYDAFAFHLLPTSLPAVALDGDETFNNGIDLPAWHVATHNFEMTNNFVVISADATTGALSWTPYLRAHSTLESILVRFFPWVAYPVVSITVWCCLLLLYQLSFALRLAAARLRKKKTK